MINICRNILYFGFLMLLVFACGRDKKGEKGFTLAVAEAQVSKAWTVDVPAILKQIVPPAFKDTVYMVSDTVRFQQRLNNTLEKASKNGGGTVQIAKGVYQVNGPIRMKSNTNLHLSEGAVLQFSSNPKAYEPLVKVRWEGTFCMNYSPLIYAVNEENIAITGKGTINGRTERFFHTWKQKQKADKKMLRQMGNDQIPISERVFGEGHFLRPTGIEFLECKNILLSDFTIKGAPFWTIHPVLSENITLRNLHIQAGTTNDDGIDPDSCKNVLIENNTIHTQDDCIAIKAGRDQDGWQYPGSENIIIRDNVMRTQVGSGFCVGSEMSGGVQNVFVERNKISSNKHAFNFKSNPDRGGFMKQLYLRNMQIDSTKYGMAFTTDYHGWRGNDYPTKYADFFIEDIRMNHTSDIPVSIIGLQREPIRRVYLKNIHIKKTDSTFKYEHVTDVLIQDMRINGIAIQPLN